MPYLRAHACSLPNGLTSLWSPLQKDEVNVLLLMKDMLRQKKNRLKYLLDQRLRMGVFLAPESQ